MGFRRTRSSAGFTIVELLIVIVVIGILAAITVVSYGGIQQRALAATLSSDLTSGSQQIKLWQVENGGYPAQVNDCPTPASGNLCLKSSSGSNYFYQINNALVGPTFCLAETNGSLTYKISQNDQASAGGCLVTAGLALHFDAASKASYSGSGTKLTDLSGNSNDATMVNNIVYDSSNGGILSFDGSGYISLPNFINQTPVNQAWSVGAAVKLVSSAPANIQKLINFNSGLSLSYGGTNRLLLYLNGGTDDYYDYGYFNLKDDAWHIVTFVFQNSNAKREIYVDGVDVSLTGPNRTSNPSGLPVSLQIGDSLVGKLGDISIYNRALSAAEVQSNYNALRGRYGR